MSNLISTGSLLAGGTGLKAEAKYAFAVPIMAVVGNPSGLIPVVTTSGICIDLTNGSIYMGTTNRTWIALGSCEY
jgi:hypothetical protein